MRHALNTLTSSALGLGLVAAGATVGYAASPGASGTQQLMQVTATSTLPHVYVGHKPYPARDTLPRYGVKLIARTAPVPAGPYVVHASIGLNLTYGDQAECWVAPIAPGAKSDPGDNSSVQDNEADEDPGLSQDATRLDDRTAVIDDVMTGVKAGRKIGVYCETEGRMTGQYVTVQSAVVIATPVGGVSSVVMK